MTCRIVSVGPTEDYKTDRTHQVETANSNVYKSLPLGQRIASSMERGIICG